MSEDLIRKVFSINEHSSLRVEMDKVLYFDPFRIPEAKNDADFIFLTHDHFDHFSPDDIQKVRNGNTFFIFPESMISVIYKLQIDGDHYVYFKPFEKRTLFDIEIEAIPAYNPGKPFHPKKNGWLGYVVSMGELKFYVCGDTDCTPETMNVSCDFLFCPVGGTYTMNAEEAAALAKKIRPKMAIPFHYGSIAGGENDGKAFCDLLKDDVDTALLIKAV